VRRLRIRVGLAALAVVAVYAVAVGTAWGRHVDALLPRHDFGSGPEYRASGDLLEAINWLTVSAAALAIVLWALLRHGAARAVRLFAGLGGTYVLALGLSLALGHLDPLGGEARRLATGYYPSGHAAMVAALALAAVATTPSAVRPVVAVLAAAAVATVGVVIVVLHSHYPSDVIGGWALAVACMPAAVAPRRYCGGERVVRAGAPARHRRGHRRARRP
jgi:hypothetical protein